MKIYLAGPCDTENRYNMVQIAKVFREYGQYEVYCPWELKIENAWDISQEEWARKVFEADIKAIQECDTFVMITPGRESTAGTNWENGYAYALNKHIVTIQITDKPTSLMTYASASEFFNSSLSDCLETVKKIINCWERWGLYSIALNGISGDYQCKTVLT